MTRPEKARTHAPTYADTPVTSKGNTMTYADFQAYMAKYGFPSCPLTEDQFNEAHMLGATDNDMYGIACDVNAGVDFHVAVKLNTQHT